MKIMTLNCGSSSIKYALLNMPNKDKLCYGIVEKVGLYGSYIEHNCEGKKTYHQEFNYLDHCTAIKCVIDILTDPQEGSLRAISDIGAVGHRVVHGGQEFSKPVLINDKVIARIKEYAELAPLHNPINLIGIKTITQLLPCLQQVAVFDTAFLTTIPRSNYIYAVPYEWYQKYSIRRFGFHGTSHRYVSLRAASFLNRNVKEINLVTLHIGNGVSVTAIKNGSAYDHSLGFTTMEGAIMGTRCGDIDPGVLLYMMSKKGFDVKQMENCLNRESGLLGITGKYSDRRDILNAIKSGDERCKLAFDMECYRLRKYIGAYIAGMGGADAIVFTAGVGENSPLHRFKICEGLEYMGIDIDNEKNWEAVGGKQDMAINKTNSDIKILVIPTNEELMIAEDTYTVLTLG